MDLKEIQERNYKATVKRGLINNDTTREAFYNKLEEEREEFMWEFLWKDRININNSTINELSDIIIVCLNIANHYNIDIQKALEDKTLYNENRND